MATTLETLCDEVLAARSAKDDLKTQVAAAEKDLGKLEVDLAAMMAKEEQEKMSHGGFTFSTASKVSWKVLSDGKDKLVTLLKEGAPELVKETVNSASLGSFLRKNESSLDDENAKWWSSAKKCLDRSEKQTLSVRKVAKKKKK